MMVSTGRRTPRLHTRRRSLVSDGPHWLHGGHRRRRDGSRSVRIVMPPLVGVACKRRLDTLWLPRAARTHTGTCLPRRNGRPRCDAAATLHCGCRRCSCCSAGARTSMRRTSGVTRPSPRRSAWRAARASSTCSSAPPRSCRAASPTPVRSLPPPRARLNIWLWYVSAKKGGSVSRVCLRLPCQSVARCRLSVVGGAGMAP